MFCKTLIKIIRKMDNSVFAKRKFTFANSKSRAANWNPQHDTFVQLKQVQVLNRFMEDIRKY